MTTDEYTPLIGLEIHVALATESKMFCGCGTEFGKPANSQVCPVCAGLPGSLPVLNKETVKLGLACAVALDANIYSDMQFERKNYHYPDLPKGYQISQLASPMAEDGLMTYKGADGHDRQVRLRRIHLEEDAGKSTHSPGKGTYVDFNRCGVPLAEIVTEPDLHTPEDTRAFLEQLRELLRHVGASEVRMEEGELRCDVNINLLRNGDATPQRTEITELKNLSSFRGVERALRYEVGRHERAIKEGDPLVHETRHWDESLEKTQTARTKEEAHDYRYFPDPDLLTFDIPSELIDELKSQMGETPREARERLQKQYELSEYDSDVLVGSGWKDFFEQTVSAGGDPKETANWIMGDIAAHLNEQDIEIDELPIAAEDLASLLSMLEDEQISGNIAKEVWSVMAETGEDPEKIVEERGLKQISDDSELENIAREVIEENQSAVEDYSGGKEKALGFLVGQIMQKTRGKANPQLANEKLREIISEKEGM